MIKNGKLSQDQIEQMKNELSVVDFKSKLNCFNCHNGLRRGELHVVVGPKGGGKSTFIKTMLLDLIVARKKTFLFLSEEEVEKYILAIHGVLFKATGDIEKTNELMGCLHIESQLNMDKELFQIDKFFKRLEHLFFEQVYDCFILDNFTTSFMSSTGKIENEAKAATLLKKLASDYVMPVVAVYHTAKTARINEKLLDSDDVRGNATIVNIGSYNYLVSTYFKENPPRAFVTVDKARYHPKANKKVFEMKYDIDLGIFTGDMASSFETMQSILNNYKKGQKNESTVQEALTNKVQKRPYARSSDDF